MQETIAQPLAEFSRSEGPHWQTVNLGIMPKKLIFTWHPLQLYEL